MQEVVHKSPQERAAALTEAFPYIDPSSMAPEHFGPLDTEARVLRDEVQEWRSYQMTDEELEPKLADIEARARASGVWNPLEGEGADARREAATEKMMVFGYEKEDVADLVAKDLNRNGYLAAIRSDRKLLEKNFKEPTGDYIESHPLSAEDEKASVDSLLERTTEIATIDEVERRRIAADFPSGNFLYHGAEAEELLSILDSGELVNARVLYLREKEAAVAAGREEGFIRRNSGFEGVSWSMNGIDALPGNRYHMAGFVAAPETVLRDDAQLVIPSRPSPNEVLQISGDMAANQYYEAKTQSELFMNPGMFGEANSVFSNLVTVGTWNAKTDSATHYDPMLHQAQAGLLSQPDTADRLRELYTLHESGAIYLAPELSQQVDNEIPVAAVWLQAAADTGRFEGTEFADMDVSQIVDSLNSENLGVMLKIMKADSGTYEKLLSEAAQSTGDVSVAIEDMYFVAPRKDAEIWCKVIARCGHMPKGVLLYDDKKVRLENFAKRHRGDHAELTAELQSAIEPGDGYIAYDEVLGKPFGEEMRTGSAHHVIAEKHLTQRKTIKKSDGRLVLEG